ncbi:MAG: hypothetical protein KY468_01745 [Armatimonadetes bacterium]|nr:hypothetical protein [Armatimonadota bacterium]
MCYRIVIGLPQAVEEKWLSRLPERMNHWMSSYSGLSERMSHFTPRVVGTSMCSCDLYHGEPDQTQQLRKKYERKGWSEARIIRVLESREKELRYALDSDFLRWLTIAAEDAKTAYLWVHWESTDSSIQCEVQISTDELRDHSVRIGEEKLYHISASA